MPPKHKAGGCGCCGGTTDTCNNCDNITYVTVSGLTNASCTSGCDGRNGTYVFRAVGDPIPPGCAWVINFGADNCGFVDPNVFIWDSAGCDTTIGVSLFTVSGGILVDITVNFKYGFGSAGAVTGYQARFRKLFANCAAIGGSIPLFSTAGPSNCFFDVTPPAPDHCDVLNCSVTIG